MEKMEIIYSEKFKRTNIRFNEKPSEEVRKELKEEGWYYSSRLNVWYPVNEAAEHSKEFAEYLRDKYYSPKKEHKEEVTSSENLTQETTKDDLPVIGTVQFESLINDLRNELKEQKERIKQLEEQINTKNNASETSLEGNTEVKTDNTSNITDDLNASSVENANGVDKDEVNNSTDFNSLPYYFYIRGDVEFDRSSISLSPENKYTSEQAIETVIKLNEKARKNNRSLFGIGVTVPGTLDHGEDFNGIGVVEFSSLEEHVYEINDLFFSTSSDISENKNYINALNELAEAANKHNIAVKFPKELLLININNDLTKAARRHALGLEPEEQKDESIVESEWEDKTDNTVSSDSNTTTEETEPDYLLEEVTKNQKSKDAFIEVMRKELEKYITDNNLDITITDMDYYDPTKYGHETGDRTLNVLVGYKSDSIKADDLYDELITNVQLSSHFLVEWQPVSNKEHENLTEYLNFLTMMNRLNSVGTAPDPIPQFQNYTDLDDILNDPELKNAYKWNLQENLNVYFRQYFPMVSVEATRIIAPNDEGYSGQNNELQVFFGYKSDALNEEIIRNNLQNDLQLFAHFNINWTPIDFDKYPSIDEYIKEQTKEEQQEENITSSIENEPNIIDIDYDSITDDLTEDEEYDEEHKYDDMRESRDAVYLKDLTVKSLLQDSYNNVLEDDVQKYVNELFPDMTIFQAKIYNPADYGMEGSPDKLHVLISFDSNEVKDDALLNTLNEELQLFKNFKTDWFPIDVKDFSSIDSFLELKKQELEHRQNREIEHKTNKQVVELRNEAKRIIEKPDDEITPEDINILKQYEGAGGIKEENRTTSGILNEFYTPDFLVEKVWKLVDHYAPYGKTVLEPSSGVGRFANNREDNDFTMYELDPTSSRINQILHPNATVINKPFQSQFFDEGGRALLPDYEQPLFDIVIGNPPYGDYNSEWKGKGDGKEFERYEDYFIDRGLQSLKDDKSILALVVPSGFLKTASDKAKELIAEKGQLLDAYRLPENTFPTTSVGTDIIIMKKADNSMSFSERLDLINNNEWFIRHPEKVLGEIKTRTNRFGKLEEYVTPHEDNSVIDELNTIDGLLENIDTGIDSSKNESPEESSSTIEKEIENEKETEVSSSTSNEQQDNEAENNDEVNYVELTDEDVDIASQVIPQSQFEATVDMATEGEEQDFFKGILKHTADTYRRIHSDNEILNEDGTHPLGYRYFYGDSEFYISEIDTDGVGFGYTVLNGDLEMSEFGSISIEELMSIEGMEMDYHVPDNISIEEMLYKLHPDYKFWFPNPAEKELLDSFEEITEDKDVEQKEKPTVVRKKKAKKGWDYEKSIGDTLSLEEFCKWYGKEYNEHDYNIWKSTDWEGNIKTENLSLEDRTYLSESNNYVEQEPNVWTHKELFASGDIYKKIRDQKALLDFASDEKEKKRYEDNIKILKEAMNTPIKLEDMHIGILTTLSNDFTIPHENELGAIEYLNLRESFILWAKGETLKNQTYRNNIDFTTARISREDFPADLYWRDIVEYIDKVSVKAEKVNRFAKWGKTDEEIVDLKKKRKTEAELKRMARQETADKFFDRYIHEGLPEEEQKRLLEVYNERFNSYKSPDYSKLPLYISGMSSHKGEKEFHLYDQQIKGISFLCNKGNGLLAYDVGVGKTAAGIVATINQLQSGRSKKPLIIVPNQVYSKWYTDIKQLFPDVEVNDLYNLNADSVQGYVDPKNPHKLVIPDGSITLVTYEALKNITFTDESISNELYDDFSRLLSADFDGSDMQNAATEEKINQAIGVASQVDNPRYFFYEDSGFDNITVDEAHHFKNLWTVPKPENKGESNEFSGIPTSIPSNRALKLYGMTQLTQRHNDNRNVFLLTATPFTNSPLEVYSMLSYMGRQRLIDSGLSSLRDFLNEFAKTKIELGVTPKGDIGTKQVMKSWKSLPALQNLLTEFIDKVSADEAGVQRPKKFLDKETGKNPHVYKLDMSQLQRDIIKVEEERMTTAEAASGDVLKAMNNMRMAMVAPALLNPDDYYDYGIKLPSTKDLVETSPKLKFVCDLIVDMYKQQPDKGQFMYMPLGKSGHKFVKEYLIEKGVPKEAIEIINGETNNTVAKKEKISAKFNNKEDQLKILIGGQNTSEGIDLNGNSFVMYNMSLGWNPSETIQAEGRIWRQGNNQNMVHCIYPEMNDSIDAVLYQKHDEKISRINDLWSYKGNDLNVEDINPEELKFELIKDPKKRVRLIIDEETKDLKAQLNKIVLKQQSFSELIMEKKSLEEYIDDIRKSIISNQEWREDYIKQGKEIPSWIDTDKKSYETRLKKNQEKLDIVTEKFKKMKVETDEEIEKHREDLANQKVEIEQEIANVNKKLPDLLKDMERQVKREKLTAIPIDKLKSQVSKLILSNLESKDEIKQETQDEVEKTNGEKLASNHEIETESVEKNVSEIEDTSTNSDNTLSADDNGQQHLLFDSAVVNLYASEHYSDYSERLPRDYKTNERNFYKEVENFVDKGRKSNYEVFATNKLPKILKFAGIENQNLMVSTDVLKNAQNFGDFSKGEIKEVLENIANPVALQLIPNVDNENNLVAYTNTFKDGKPMVVSFNYDTTKTSLVVSGIDTISDKQFLNKDGKFIYINDNKLPNWISETKEKTPHLEINTDVPGIKKYKDYEELYTHPFSLINNNIDDSHLTNKQMIEINKTKNKIVDPIIDNTEKGLWVAFKDFKEYGVFDIKGKQIELENGGITKNGLQQLKAAMDIYRNKQFESFRYIFVEKKEGKIIDQLAVSAHLPTCCPMSEMDDPFYKNLDDVVDRAREKDCRVVVAHNHPSGNPEPSEADKDLTNYLEMAFQNRLGKKAFLGHIILDHNSFSFKYPDNIFWDTIHTNNVSKDKFLKDNIPNWFLSSVGDQEALKNVANEVNDMNNWNDNFIPIVFADAGLKVTAMKLYNKDFIMNHNYESLHNKLQMDAYDLYATSVFPVITNETWNKLSPNAQLGLEIQLKNGVKKNCFTDAAFEGTSVINKYHIKPGKFYTEPKRFDKVEVKNTWNKRIDITPFETSEKQKHSIEMER